MLYFLGMFIVFVLIELLYFEFAKFYGIVDRPNHRSSHQTLTIRGGGIVVVIAALVDFFLSGMHNSLFLSGLLIISIISFLDDIFTLNNKIRLVVHLFAVTLLFLQLGIFDMSGIILVLSGVLVIGIINAYNFMDGINGLTGLYSLLVISSLYYINSYTSFISGQFLAMIGLALLVFNIFNFRRQAKCFAGDVGSISIAFVVVFSIGSLILATNNFNYLLLLLVYGLDAGTTIVLRIIRRENIFEAHRSHFYQFLANERKIPHLLISIIYFFVQLIINITIIVFLKNDIQLGLGFLTFCTLAFLFLRFRLQGRALVQN